MTAQYCWLSIRRECLIRRRINAKCPSRPRLALNSRCLAFQRGKNLISDSGRCAPYWLWVASALRLCKHAWYCFPGGPVPLRYLCFILIFLCGFSCSDAQTFDLEKDGVRM